MTTGPGPLAGIRVIELGAGVGGAWCGRMLADLGATVMRVEPDGGDPLRRRREQPDEPATEGLLHAWLDRGKQYIGRDEAADRVADVDLLLVGEAASVRRLAAKPRCATVDLSWFGREGPNADWHGADVVVQALTGMIHPCGPVEGPPQQLGDIQSALVGGATAATAALAALHGGGAHRDVEVSILEACMILAELQVSDEPMLGRPTPRVGVNRFSPTCPVGIHRCRDGWIGVTIITPAQWAAFCDMLGTPELAADPGLATIHLRSQRADELEAILDDKLRARTVDEWAALGREKRVPVVIVPNAGGLLEHPIFTERGTLGPVAADRPGIVGPNSPLRVSAPGGRRDPGGAERPGREPGPEATAPEAPLAGVRVVDFSMGWAGPVATRILADLGAEVLKIEAGRYPDWWRSTQWTPEAIESGQYETSWRFAAVNRGKKGVSLDLTTPDGVALARRLVDASAAVVENHAAGVIDRLGMGWRALGESRPDLVMLSMSAFGTGNAWSDTRAYGSTLEQASGMPSFRGPATARPTMGHIAYGDPIGGLYGAAAVLAGLVHRQRTGRGQWLNLSQVECLLPFTAPALLVRSATGREPARLGNRHVAMVPHGIYPAAGDDRWIAIAVESHEGWQALARLLGRDEWRADAYADIARRRALEHEIDAAIATWTRSLDAAEASAALQAVGIAAAPVLTPKETLDDPHHRARDFYVDATREHIGAQVQIAMPLRIDGRRPRFRGVAPFLGADTRDVLADVLGVDDAHYARLVDAGVVSLRPTTLRGGGT